MTSLVAVSAHLPRTVPIASLQDELELSDTQLRRLRRLYGLDEVCRTDASEADLLLAAAEKLDDLAGLRDRIRYVVRAKTLPAACPYPSDPMLDVRDALGLSGVPTFDLTDHACASGLLAVDVCGSLLAADGDPDALALVLTGEKAFTRLARIIPDTAIMGEATAAVLVGPGTDRDVLLGYATTTLGGPGGAVVTDEEQTATFRRIYPGTLAEVAHGALDAAGLDLSDVDLVLPHNVNRISWVRAGESIGVPRDRIFLGNVGVTGHCFCADPFLNLATATSLGLLAPGAHYLMVAVGLGSTFSAMVFRH